MKNFEKVLKKIKWGQTINCIVFMSLLWFVFSRTTYLFRIPSVTDRDHIIGIKEEENIDVVCVGGSSTFVYWEPFLAWNDYGMTSYNLATNSVRPVLMKSYVREAKKTQDPDLMVIDVRSYAYEVRETLAVDEGAMRKGIDSLDLSLDRLNSVNEIIDYYNAKNDGVSDIWSYYFDIAKYHANYQYLGVKNNWKHINNTFSSKFKGFEFVTAHAIVDEPKDIKTDEMGMLNTDIKKSLLDLLEYLKEEKINALFVASPISVDLETQVRYNSIGAIVESSGYSFLNTNDFYDEMALDFSKDFYNKGHVNVYGAEKYTKFVSNYIKEHYTIADHRNDPLFKEWNEYYESALVLDTKTKNMIDKLIVTKKNAYEEGVRLTSIDDVEEWTQVASNTNYSVIVASNGETPNVKLPWNIKDNQKDIIRVYSASKLIYESNSSLPTAYSKTFGTSDIKYSVNSGSQSLLTVGESNYDINRQEGTYILVFDNNYNQVLDVVRIHDKDGFARIQYLED